MRRKTTAVDLLDKEERRIRDQMTELKSRLKTIYRKKERLKSLRYTCPTCGGSGLESVLDAAGAPDSIECRTCRGLGKVDEVKCLSCGRIITVDMINAFRKGECPWCGRGFTRDIYGF